MVLLLRASASAAATHAASSAADHFSVAECVSVCDASSSHQCRPPLPPRPAETGNDSHGSRASSSAHVSALRSRMPTRSYMPGKAAASAAKLRAPAWCARTDDAAREAWAEASAPGHAHAGAVRLCAAVADDERAVCERVFEAEEGARMVRSAAVFVTATCRFDD